MKDLPHGPDWEADQQAQGKKEKGLKNFYEKEPCACCTEQAKQIRKAKGLLSMCYKELQQQDKRIEEQQKRLDQLQCDIGAAIVLHVKAEKVVGAGRYAVKEVPGDCYEESVLMKALGTAITHYDKEESR